MQVPYCKHSVNRYVMCIGFLIINITDGAGAWWYTGLLELFQQLTAVLQSSGVMVDAASGTRGHMKSSKKSTHDIILSITVRQSVSSVCPASSL